MNILTTGTYYLSGMEVRSNAQDLVPYQFFNAIDLELID